MMPNLNSTRIELQSPVGIWPKRAAAALLAYLLATSHFLFAQEQLEVSLGTLEKLNPLYLEFENGGSPWPDSHCRALEKIARFDLNANGFTRVLPANAGRSQTLRQAGLQGAASCALNWTPQGVHYLVYIRLSGTSLELMCGDLRQRRQKRLPTLELTGSLSVDRVVVHRALREVHRQWRGDPGITCGKILYSWKKSSKRAEIWECDFDGGNARALTDEGDLALMPTPLPATGPLAKGFLYVSYKSGQPGIYLARSPKMRGIKVCQLFGNQLMPTYNSNSDHLALVCDHFGHPDLYLQSLIGADRKRAPKRLFCTSRGVQASPTFSPDGKKLAFVSNKDGSPRIYCADLRKKLPMPESAAHLLTRKNRENTAPTWSPDGTKLAFSAKENSTRQIWIYDFVERREFALTRGGHHKENPAWAPDSLHLIYNSADPDRAELYLIDLTRQVPLLITTGGGEKRFATWRFER